MTDPRFDGSDAVGAPVGRVCEVVGAYDLVATLRPIADSAGDPTWRFGTAEGNDRIVRAMWTPQGAATIEVVADAGYLRSTAWGPGARWISERVDWMCGLHDDPVVPTAGLHRAVAAATRETRGFRMARALGVFDLIVPTVLGQRVTTGEAHRSWRELVRKHGHRAPGSDEVRLGPAPRTLERLGDADWHQVGVERGRAAAVRALLKRLGALERAAGVLAPPSGADGSATRGFREVAEGTRGIGPWTSTALAISVLGDPDVVLLGDLHMPHGVCHALAGEERGSDDRMLELLEPFRPHRGRVARLLKSTGRAAAPRRGPRYTPLPMARM